MPDNIDVSIIIVTWNSGGEIENCLNSVYENSMGISYEVIVVDNSSSDDTEEIVKMIFENKFRNKKLIINKENSGYTKACNEGISESSGKNIFLLNPDTKLTKNSVEVLLRKLNENEKTGAAAPQLLNEDHTVQKSCRTFPGYFDMFCEISLLSYFFPDSETFSRWKMNYFSHNEEREVEQPMAAALMIKKSVLEETGNFDEDFYMFFNDVDLCKRITDNGYNIIFYPESKIIHQKGVSIYKDRVRMIKVWNGDCLKYFKKHNDNTVLYILLLISLKITGFFRILFYKLIR